MAKGIFPIEQDGLDIYNQIIAEQFDEDALDETRRALEYRDLIPCFIILKEKSTKKPLVEPIGLSQKDYFLETTYNTNGAPQEFILYDKDYNPLIRSHDIFEITNILINLKKS